MNLVKSNELSAFPVWSVTFLTFIYAAALDIVLTHYLLNSEHSFLGIFALLSFVVVLASDWSSKARARIVLHESSKFSSESLNSIWVFAAELAMVFSLIIGSSYLLEHHFDPGYETNQSTGLAIAYVAASMFACLSHVWDIILIRAANNKWRHVVTAFVSGTLETQEWYARYLPRLILNRERTMSGLQSLKESANDELKTVLDDWSKRPAQIVDFLRWLRIFIRSRIRLVFHEILRLFYQLLIGWLHGWYSAVSYFAAFHLLASNLIFSILIFLHFLAAQGIGGQWITGFSKYADGSLYSQYPYVCATLIFLSGFLLPIAHWLFKRKAYLVVVSSIIWVLLVSMLPALWVIIVLVAQQILVTLFFHRFSLSSRSNNHHTQRSTNCAFE